MVQEVLVARIGPVAELLQGGRLAVEGRLHPQLCPLEVLPKPVDRVAQNPQPGSDFQRLTGERLPQLLGVPPCLLAEFLQLLQQTSLPGHPRPMASLAGYRALHDSSPGGAGAAPRRTPAAMDARLPSLQFSVLCLGVDEKHGPPCFMYVFYELPLAEFPYRFPDTAGFFLVNGWSGGLGQFTQRVRILDPEGQPVLETGARPMTLENPDVPFMSVNFIQGFEFARPGVYRVETWLDDRLVLSHALTARLAPNAVEAEDEG